MDILKRILFCLVLIGFIGGEVLRFDNGEGVAITFFDISVILFVGLTLLVHIFQKKKIIISLFQKYALWFVGIGLVSLLLHIPQLTYYQLLVSFLYAIRFIVYTIGIAWSVELLDVKFKKLIPYLLLGASTLLSLLGFTQYLLYPALRNLYYAGWDEHLYRIFSTFLDPNFMGLFYIFGLILGIYMLLEKWKRSSTLVKAGFSLVTFLNLIALFLTYSRGAYLAFLVAFCVILSRSGFKKFIFIAFGILVLLLIGIELISPRSEGTKLFRTASIRDRVISLQSVTTIIAHNPFLGVGFDAYRYAQQKEGLLKANSDTTHSGAGTDNSFLFVFATTGVAGFLAYILMTFQLLKVSYVQKTSIGKTIFASYIALIIGSFFVNALFYPFLLVWVWMLLGITSHNS